MFGNLKMFLYVLLWFAVAKALFIPKTCFKVNTEMCRKLDPEHYTWTYFPNFMNQTSYEQVNYEIEQYQPLIENKCSEDMAMFLCSLYVPICREGVKLRIPPCKSLCESARDGCSSLLSQATIKWPDSMRCDRFPIDDDNVLCIPPKKKQIKRPVSKVVVTQPTPNLRKKAHVLMKKKDKPGQSIRLRCDVDEKIAIRKVRFFPHHVHCCPGAAIKKVYNQCKGKNYCELQVDDVIKAADCKKNVQFITTKFKCVSRDKDAEPKARGCSRNS